jgi:hypothetical protein
LDAAHRPFVRRSEDLLRYPGKHQAAGNLIPRGGPRQPNLGAVSSALRAVQAQRPASAARVNPTLRWD